MSTEDVRQSIASLRAEISKLDSEDETSRAELNGIVDRLERRADMQDALHPADEHNAILELVAGYEARHPRLTLMVNDLMTRLMSMGI